MRSLVLALCCLAAAAAQRPARFSDPDRIEKIRATAPAVEKLFEAYAKKEHLPGLVYGVIVDQKLLYSGSFGFTNIQHEIPADTRSLFRIASMSKSFTALAILQLRDAGKLRLDEPAENYLAELARLDYPTGDSPKITVRDLLTHSAGFPEDNPWGDRQLADSDQELMDLVESGISFSNVPGVAYEYSNLGFAILGQIVQRVSGMPFPEYMAKHVFKPLGMNETVWEFENAPKERLAFGYGWRDGLWFDEPLLHHGAFGAMGGLITSIEDFSRYAALHLSAWPPRSAEDPGPLRRSSLREMHQPWRFSGIDPSYRYPSGAEVATASAYAFGLGWMRDSRGRIYLGHSGGLPGFGSNWTMMPDYGIAVVSMNNRTYAATRTLNRTVLDTIVSSAGLQPRTLLVSPILAQRKKELLELLPDFENVESAGLFAENFFLDLPLPLWKRRARDLFAQAGPIQRSGAMQPENRLRGSFILEGETARLHIRFTLTPHESPQIQQLQMRILDD
jgi:CubicO group peptidase (beta-lactamase class C family)